MAKGKAKPSTTAVADFIDTTPVTSLKAVVGFSSAVLSDYVKGTLTKTDAVNLLHVLETGPARHIHATLERATKLGGALEPFLGVPASSPVPVLEVREQKQLSGVREAVYEE